MGEKRDGDHAKRRGRRIVLAGLVGQGVAHAAPFDCSSGPGYCIGEGDAVIFRFAGSSSSMGLFGTLEVIGNSMVAYPTEFGAESSGSVQDGINDNGTVQVFTKAGYRFDAVTIVERGAYSMSAADSSVDVTAFMSVADHNDPLFGAYDDANLGLTVPLNIQDG